jgi:hypothetical protein
MGSGGDARVRLAAIERDSQSSLEEAEIKLSCYKSLKRCGIVRRNCHHSDSEPTD